MVYTNVETNTQTGKTNYTKCRIQYTLPTKYIQMKYIKNMKNKQNTLYQIAKHLNK